MRFGFIQGVAIWEKDMVAVIFILSSSSALTTAIIFIQLQTYVHSTWLDKDKDKEALSD